MGSSITSLSEETRSLKQTDSLLAMAMRCILLTMLAQVTRGEKVALNTEKMPCPSTSFYFSSATDAAGGLVWEGPMSPTPGQCYAVGSTVGTHMKVCGPGTVKVSRMSCNYHDYKATTITHSKSDYVEGDCQVYAAAGSVVEGYLGSFSYSC